MPVARVSVVDPQRAELLVEDSGRWLPLVVVLGVDAEARALDLRRLVEAGLVAPAALTLADPARAA